jgi:iduronate 2-sulfatase
MRLGKIFHGGDNMEDPKAWDVAIYPRVTEAGRKGEGRNLTGGKIKWCWWQAAEGTDEDQPDGQIAARAVEFLNQTHEQPFFLALGFYKPHDPFVAPKKYFEPYPQDKVKVHVDPAGRSPTHPLALGGGWKVEFDRFTDRERLEFRRAYYAGTSFVDAQIGKVIDVLKRRGLLENTIVVLLGDHGYHLGERGWWNKNTLYELSCRAPLIVYAPGMKADGRSCTRVVEFVDIYPTLAELCRLEPPADLEGRSLCRLLNDPAEPWVEEAFTQVQRGPTPGWSVRTPRWRYIEWGQGRAGAELYDHNADPGEWHNLADSPEHAGTRSQLRRLVLAQFNRSRE